MRELKSCPFCGYENPVYAARYGRYGIFLLVRCDSCGVESKKIGLGKDFIEPPEYDFLVDKEVEAACHRLRSAWNRRCSDAEQDN